MIDTNQLGTYLSNRWEEAAKASRDAARGTLLLLALQAREDYPTATGIRLGASDQGDFMDVEGVLDANGNRFDGDEDFDDEALGWGLDDHNKSAWEPYCTEAEGSRRRDPKYIINIDQVLAEIPGKVSQEEESPKVQIIHSRDPDSECGLTVFVNGVKVEDFTEEDIDPGRGYDEESIQERRDEAEAKANRPDATEFDKAVAAALSEARFERFAL